MPRAIWLLLHLLLCFALLPVHAGGVASAEAIASAEPDPALAQRMFGRKGPLTIQREADGVPGWKVSESGNLVGYIGSTWEIAGSTGYSGRPLDVLVAITPAARIAGARLMRHDEPVLTLGISDEDIIRYVDGFAGVDLAAPRPDVLTPQSDLPDVISRATVSTGVIRDGILRTARTFAIARGLIAEGGGIDRIGYSPADWKALLAMGALAHAQHGRGSQGPSRRGGARGARRGRISRRLCRSGRSADRRPESSGPKGLRTPSARLAQASPR